MKTKRLLLVLSLPVILLSVLTAQQAPTPVGEARERDPGKRQELVLENLKKDLSLTPEQEIKVKELLERRNQQAAAERLAHRERMQTQTRDFDARMKQILTAEQNQRYEALKVEKRAEIRENRGERLEQNRRKRQGVRQVPQAQ